MIERDALPSPFNLVLLAFVAVGYNQPANSSIMGGQYLVEELLEVVLQPGVMAIAVSHRVLGAGGPGGGTCAGWRIRTADAAAWA